MSFLDFKKGFEKHINRTFKDLLSKSEAEIEAVITKHQQLSSQELTKDQIGYEVKLSIPKLYEKKAIIKYCILSWYVHPWLQFELQEFLRKRCTQLRLFEIEALYLYSKELMLYTLFRENDFSHSCLFGNVLIQGIFQNSYYFLSNQKKKLRIRKDDFFSLRIVYRKTPKKKVWRRGYNDHGSLPPLGSRDRREANMENQYLYDLERTNLQLSAKNKQIQFLIQLKGIDP